MTGLDNDNKFAEIFKSLSDRLSLLILHQILDEDKYPMQISENLKKPNSTITKKLKELEVAGLVTWYHKTGTTDRRVKMYRFKNVEFTFGSVKDIITTTLKQK